jgi:signal recognition particle subunit SRP54
MIKMGGMQSLMGMMPGMGKMSKKMETSGFDDNSIKRQLAIIQSMTKKERANPLLLQASRKKRVSAGSGTEIPELNRLLKMHRQMSDMMKKLGRSGNKGMLRGMMGQMMGKGISTPTLPENVDNGISQTKFGNLSGLNLPGNLSGLGKKNR